MYVGGRQKKIICVSLCVCVCKSQHSMDSAEGFAQALLCGRVHKMCIHAYIYTHTICSAHKWNHVLQRFHLNGHLFEDRQDINAQKHLKAGMCQKNEMNCMDKDATQERSEQELTDSLNKSRQTYCEEGRGKEKYGSLFDFLYVIVSQEVDTHPRCGLYSGDRHPGLGL